jgi:signal recognition particle receptor subunit beta
VSLINPLAREISAKIVYYGPGLSGKTTSLKALYAVIRPERRGELVTLATEGDRTLFFDFLPITLERVQEMPVRLQLYTVPGQIFYAATRKMVLNGVDGVVFVADSQEAARDSNRTSLEDLRDNLRTMGMDLGTFPHVFQYNKRDLRGVVTVQAMEAELNAHKAPAFETCALRGIGVVNALREITRLVVADLRRKQAPARRTMVPVLGTEREAGLGEQLSAVVGGVAASPEPVLPREPVRPLAPGLSFAALWPRDGTAGVDAVEEHLRNKQHGPAVRAAAAVLAEMLDSLPGATTGDGSLAKAATLGLCGTEYLRFCRLASAPDAAVTEADGLFGLYMLVAARIKHAAL